MAANPREGDYNGAVECDVNDVIPERIEPTDQVIPSERQHRQRAIRFMTFDIRKSCSPEIIGPYAAFTCSRAVTSTSSAGCDIFVIPDGTQIVMHEIAAERIGEHQTAHQ